MTEKLTPLERDVIAAILSPDHPVLDALRRQLEACHAASRWVTGVGFFTHLSVPAGVVPAPVKPGTLDLGDVTLTSEALRNGAGFVLFVRDGVLDVLEGFSYDEPWVEFEAPYVVRSGEVTHSAGSKTDIEQVDEAWVK